MRISDWSSDVCSSDVCSSDLDSHADLAAEVAFDHVLADFGAQALDFRLGQVTDPGRRIHAGGFAKFLRTGTANAVDALQPDPDMLLGRQVDTCNTRHARSPTVWRPDREIRRSEHEILTRSEEHTSELQSLMRISYAVFCMKKQTTHKHHSN